MEQVYAIISKASKTISFEFKAESFIKLFVCLALLISKYILRTAAERKHFSSF